MAKRIRKRAIDLDGLKMTEEGVFSGYYKLNEIQGLKVLQCEGYTSIKKLRKSRMWRHATRESSILKKVQKRVTFTPKFFETVPVKYGRYFFPGILMQHIEGELLCSYYRNKDERESILEELQDKLEEFDIIHEDLHGGNAIFCKELNMIYVIDFTPEFIEIL